jgi:ABC-type multidrug transport system ATPase subunit
MKSLARGTPSSRLVNGIEVREVSKSLLGKTILTNAELTVPKGTVAVIEGDNGAGKTTFVRILATVVSPDTGSVTVNGFDAVKRGIDVRRSIGVSFANERSLYWRISANQNLELFGKINGLSKRVIAARSEQLLDALQLKEMAKERVARMSTGQRQRLMVARALLANPPVLLLDEPFRGLDGNGLRALIDLVAQCSKDGMTTLIVAPLVEAVLPIADATYRISEGAIRMIPMAQTRPSSAGQP